MAEAAVQLPRRATKDGCQHRCKDTTGVRYNSFPSTRQARWHVARHSINGHQREAAPKTSSEQAATAEVPSRSDAAATEVASSASFALRCANAGREAMDMGRCHKGLSLFLRAERLAAKAPGQESQMVGESARRFVSGLYNSTPSLVPQQAKRNGSLLLREPPGPGFRHPAVYANGTSKLEDSSTNKPTGQWRYEPWLCGGELPRVDCATPAGFQRALEYIARRVPIVMTNLGVMPAISKWSNKYLQDHTTEWPGMDVLKSAGSENRYLYYLDEQADRDMSAFRGAPRQASQNFRMSYRSFVQSAKENPEQCYYLQAPLVLRSETDQGQVRESWCKGIDDTLRADCDRDLNRDRLRRIETAGQFGLWSRSQLFVGPGDTLSPMHYDQYDNIFLQVAGKKHFLLFDPRAAEGLYPFPACHPYDEYAMLDLERVDHKSFPRAKATLTGRGACTTLGPGESLYIPTHWWHHVQGAASTKDAHSISVNFWYVIHNTVVQAPHPLPLHLELELARHVELLLSDVCGSSTVGHIVEALLADVDDANAVEKNGGVEVEDFVSLPVRNFVLFRLARLLGAEAARNFVHEYFPRERFDRATVLRALHGPQRGAREKA